MKQTVWDYPLFCVLAMLLASACCVAQPRALANSRFDSYIRGVEQRLNQQHRCTTGFIALDTAGLDASARLRQGEVIVEKIAAPASGSSDGALLHHWRGTAFVGGATSSDIARLMRDFAAYPQNFSPQVLSGSVLDHEGDRFRVVMRVRQHHVITVVMDTSYDVTFGQLSPQFGYSLSRSTRVSEIDGAGTAGEHELSLREEHGFLWRLNTYWSWYEADGGLYMQIESVSLTRDIPHGLGWAIRPFVQSIPRESLEFTLHATGDALRKSGSRENARR